MSLGDTIVAQSTPYGFGGIAVVRLSGADSIKILKTISKQIKNPKSWVAQKTKIYHKKDVLDETVVVCYNKPKSFTGENMVEISCHGNPFIVDGIINECIGRGARSAGPGEFTRRAFENGKIDLIQAESIANTIAASSKAGLFNAISGLGGEMSKAVNNTSKDITELLSYCEHLLDVSDEDIQKDNKTHVSKKTSEINIGLVKLIENYDTCRVLTYGAIVVLAGKTNSGKSTLFNALVGKNRSIVNEAAGTTRDYVDANISISGVPIRLVDTAGVRRSKNMVEVEGIDNSIMLIEKADLVCLVRDISVKNDLYVDDIVELKNDNIIYINNKTDLINEVGFNKKKDLYLYVSALNRTGISRLKSAILERLNVEKIPNKLTGVSTPRQYECITDCIKSLAATNKMIKNGFQLELICYELENALICINSLLGVETGELVLNNMFDSFCVGK